MVSFFVELIMYDRNQMCIFIEIAKIEFQCSYMIYHNQFSTLQSICNEGDFKKCWSKY